MFRTLILNLRSLSLIGFAVVAASFVGTTPAAATVVIIPSLEEMTRRADVVIHARVGEIGVVEQRGHVVTAVEIEIIESWKGAKSGETIKLYQLGGEMNGRREFIVGQHQWAVGDEFVLFGVNYEDGVISYGIGMGKFEVMREDGVPVVKEIFGDVAVMSGGPGVKGAIVAPPARTARSMVELKNDVLTFAKKGQLKPGEHLKTTAPDFRKPRPLGKLPGEGG